MNNEDLFVVLPGSGVASVIDGMGGQASGEVASALFAETVQEIFENSAVPDADAAADLVAESFRVANGRIYGKAMKDPRHRGMGCTAEVIVFHDSGYVLGHVGDSRSYLFRQGVLSQVTKDHSLVQEHVDNGIITPSEAKNHAFKNLILRAVGVEETLAMDLLRGDHRPGDLFLLCSDGLSDMMDDEGIQAVLDSRSTISEKADRLVEMAKIAGGRDNITVVVCEVLPPG